MQLYETNLRGVTRTCADISGGRKNGIVSGISCGNSPNDGKNTNVLYILSVQETNTRDNSKVQIITLVDMDVERRSIL